MCAPIVPERRPRFRRSPDQRTDRRRVDSAVGGVSHGPTRRHDLRHHVQRYARARRGGRCRRGRRPRVVPREPLAALTQRSAAARRSSVLVQSPEEECCMEGLSPLHLIIVLVIAVLVLGPGKLPEVGTALRKSIREFRNATTDMQDSVRLDTPPAALPAPVPAPSAAAVPPVAAEPTVVEPAPPVSGSS